MESDDGGSTLGEIVFYPQINILHSLTEKVTDCMRKHNIKRASGSWSDYYLALDIAKKEIKTRNQYELKERIYQWVLPR